MQNLKLTFKLKSFHPYYINRALLGIISQWKKINYLDVSVSALPKNYERFTVLKSPHVDKKARNQYERVTYNRALIVSIPTKKTSLNKEEIARLLNSLEFFAVGVQITLINIQKTENIV